MGVGGGGEGVGVGGGGPVLLGGWRTFLRGEECGVGDRTHLPRHVSERREQLTGKNNNIKIFLMTK